jgi:hypothetical protein
MRRLLIAGSAACLALALGGCVVFTVSPSATASPLGPVVIETTLCGSDASAPFTRGCRDDGNSDIDSDDLIDDSGAALQLLLGYRVPAGAAAPLTFSGGLLNFTRSPSYTGELERLAPAPAGFQWVGYISDSFPYNPHSSGQVTRVTTAASFGLPRAPDGAPFQGPFRYRPVVGSRFVGSEPARPVACGDSLFEITQDSICVDAPSPSELASNLSVATSDLGIVPGPEVTGAPGTTAALSFSARYAGGAAANFAVRASTSLPGAIATPSVGSLAPAAGSTTPVQVSVAVPADAPPGRYEVALTASLDADRTRSGTATLIVPALPPPPPPPPPPPVRIAAPGAIGKVVRYRTRRGRIPKTNRLCLPPGRDRAQKRC